MRTSAFAFDIFLSSSSEGRRTCAVSCMLSGKNVGAHAFSPLAAHMRMNAFTLVWLLGCHVHAQRKSTAFIKVHQGQSCNSRGVFMLAPIIKQGLLNASGIPGAFDSKHAHKSRKYIVGMSTNRRTDIQGILRERATMTRHTL